jgi:hypothetical protein
VRNIHTRSSATDVSSIPEAIARMEAIEQALPAADGLACFDRMYLDVTRSVAASLSQGFFADPDFMTRLDVNFANLYLEAAACADQPASAPVAWRPLIERRSLPGIEPIQFALAGMNTHINHDLPLAVVATCTDLGTQPTAGSISADYQKVDELLDAAEESIRRSFESNVELAVDRHLQAVENLVATWTINDARDLAWNNALLLWELRDARVARDLLLAGLGAATELATRTLLVEV